MTPRPVKEWIGKRPESMPGKLVMLRLYAKQNGLCACGCGMVMNLNRDQVDCDHKLALIDGGENRETNLQLLLRQHHRAKTSVENSQRAQARRHQAKAFAKPKGSMRGAGFRKGVPQRTATRKIEKWSLLS
jgi:5-methylcytosine-specific restriction endonuclease McrA